MALYCFGHIFLSACIINIKSNLFTLVSFTQTMRREEKPAVQINGWESTPPSHRPNKLSVKTLDESAITQCVWMLRPEGPRKVQGLIRWHQGVMERESSKYVKLEVCIFKLWFEFSGRRGYCFLVKLVFCLDFILYVLFELPDSSSTSNSTQLPVNYRQYVTASTSGNFWTGQGQSGGRSVHIWAQTLRHQLCGPQRLPLNFSSLIAFLEPL